MCRFCWNVFCVPVIIESCSSIFKLLLTWLTYSVRMVEYLYTYKSKCKIYQVVNSDWITRRFSLLWDLNIGIKLKLVKLVSNRQRQKIVERYSKRLLWSGIPREDEATFLVLIDKSNKDLIPKVYWILNRKEFVQLFSCGEIWTGSSLISCLMYKSF